MAKIEQFKAFIKNFVAYKKTGCILYRPGQFYFISCLEQGLCKETIYLFIIVVDYALRTALDVYLFRNMVKIAKW